MRGNLEEPEHIERNLVESSDEKKGILTDDDYLLTKNKDYDFYRRRRRNKRDRKHFK
jgi:hypothetical protein